MRCAERTREQQLRQLLGCDGKPGPAICAMDLGVVQVQCKAHCSDPCMIMINRPRRRRQVALPGLAQCLPAKRSHPERAAGHRLAQPPTNVRGGGTLLGCPTQRPAGRKDL